MALRLFVLAVLFFVIPSQLTAQPRKPPTTAELAADNTKARETLLKDAPKALDKFNYGQPATDYGLKRWYQDQDGSVDDYERDGIKLSKLAREISQR